MRKSRYDSTWNQLSPEQRVTLEGWLFNENLGYAETLKRVQKEFGVEATIASMGRFYRRPALERQVEELVEAKAAACELNKLPVSTDSLREAALKLVGKAALKLATERPDDLEQLASFIKLLLESEENDLRRSRLKLAERQFHYEATAASQKDPARFNAYLAGLEDDTSLSQDEKLERFRVINSSLERLRARMNGQANSSSGN